MANKDLVFYGIIEAAIILDLLLSLILDWKQPLAQSVIMIALALLILFKIGIIMYED